MHAKTAIGLMTVALVTACGEPPPAKMAPPPADLSTPAPHGLDAAKIAHGGEIYRQRCAVCHGDKAQGAQNWVQHGPDGKFPPPPLDASGHAWHHPKSMLTQTIKQGTVKTGGGMPAWDSQLSDDDIEDVLAWIVSRWPDEVYRNWVAIRNEPQHSTHAH